MPFTSSAHLSPDFTSVSPTVKVGLPEGPDGKMIHVTKYIETKHYTSSIYHGRPNTPWSLYVTYDVKSSVVLFCDNSAVCNSALLLMDISDPSRCSYVTISLSVYFCYMR